MEQLWLMADLLKAKSGEKSSAGGTEEMLTVDGRCVPLVLVRNARARHYLLSLRRDGTARVTVPRGGTLIEARRFAHSKSQWLRRQLRRMDATPLLPKVWCDGTGILFDGETLELRHSAEMTFVLLGPHQISVPARTENLRPYVEAWMQNRARQVLPLTVAELSVKLGLEPLRTTVRNQSSRWGSCSSRRTISLNWRLVQVPPAVREYVVIHELAHLKEMNHGRAFWKLVAEACPDYEKHERWLKENGARLGM